MVYANGFWSKKARETSLQRLFVNCRFKQAQFSNVNNIPQQTNKAVLNACNGFHQVLLYKYSIKLRNFIKESKWCQFHHILQGQLESAISYTRYCNIMPDVP